MAYLPVVPEWFFNFGIALELIFAIVAATVAFYSYQIYRLTEQRESKLFTFAFSLISISYIVKAAANLFVLREIKDGLLALSQNSLNYIGQTAIYSHMLIFIAGLVTLTYLVSKAKDMRAYWLTMALSFLLVTYGRNIGFAFSLASSLMILYVASHYLAEYKKNKNIKTLLVLLAFILLLVSTLIGVIAQNFYINYMLGHLFELACYIFILISLIFTIRKK